MAYMREDNIQGFGYTEMYEWSDVPEHKDRLGRFVTFDSKNPKLIKFAHNDDEILGVTTVCAEVTSDDPDEWKYAFLCNEFGDLYLQKERLAVGAKQYDQFMEINYIKTYPWEHYIKIKNKHYDEKLKYAKRSNRPEWVRVNLLGKTIVRDNGQCKAGEYCTVYQGKIKDLYGTAIPVTKEMKNKKKFYVLERLSDNTVLILNK